MCLALWPSRIILLRTSSRLKLHFPLSEMSFSFLQTIHRRNLSLHVAAPIQFQKPPYFPLKMGEFYFPFRVSQSARVQFRPGFYCRAFTNTLLILPALWQCHHTPNEAYKRRLLWRFLTFLSFLSFTSFTFFAPCFLLLYSLFFSARFLLTNGLDDTPSSSFPFPDLFFWRQDLFLFLDLDHGLLG